MTSIRLSRRGGGERGSGLRPGTGWPAGGVAAGNSLRRPATGRGGAGAWPARLTSRVTRRGRRPRRRAGKEAGAPLPRAWRANGVRRSLGSPANRRWAASTATNRDAEGGLGGAEAVPGPVAAGRREGGAGGGLVSGGRGGGDRRGEGAFSPLCVRERGGSGDPPRVEGGEGLPSSQQPCGAAQLRQPPSPAPSLDPSGRPARDTGGGCRPPPAEEPRPGLSPPAGLAERCGFRKRPRRRLQRREACWGAGGGRARLSNNRRSWPERRADKRRQSLVLALCRSVEPARSPRRDPGRGALGKETRDFQAEKRILFAPILKVRRGRGRTVPWRGGAQRGPAAFGPRAPGGVPEPAGQRAEVRSGGGLGGAPGLPPNLGLGPGSRGREGARWRRRGSCESLRAGAE